MQQNESKNLQFSKKFGKIIKKFRIKNTRLSVNKLAYSYEISRGNLSKIENGLVDCKLITAWKLAEALGMKPHELIKILESELGEDFKFMDE